MPKKPTYEEKVIAEAANLIMQTIHIAANRIAEKYEKRLMQEVVTRMQDQMKANEDVNKYTGDYINNK